MAAANGYRWRFLSDVELFKNSYEIQFYSQILPLIKPEWKPESLTFQVFKSGVTNTLVAFYPEGLELNEAAEEDNVVLLRLNGEGTEKIIDRIDEVVSMLCFNQAGFCAPVYAQLKNGLCYGFCPGRRLEIQEATEDWSMMRKIARLTAKLHSLDIPSYFKGREPFLWLKIYQLLAHMPYTFSDPDTQKAFVNSIGSTQRLKSEIEWLKEIIKSSSSPVVLCHNDIHSGNIIYNNTTGQVSLVDFEYSGPNYLAFDIANHFCEFAGVEEVNYECFPEEGVQKRWIQMYLEEAAKLQGKCDQSADIMARGVNEVYEDVRKFVLGCHLFWVVWSMFQAKNSTLDFDFMEYGIQRYQEYLKRKSLYLKAQSNSAQVLA